MSESFANINNETVFTNSTLSLAENDEDLVSDRVNILANSVYEEFENLIRKHGEGTVDGIMPLVVAMLETMDKLYTLKDELALQLDLTREDQSQLYTQYEREKLSRKLAEEKINRIEDNFEEERQQFENRIETLETNCKLGEMKLKNCRDLISRHEEKEFEMRKEFSNLQQRYSELLRNKADHKHRNINSQCTAEEVSSGNQSPQLLNKSKPDKSNKSVEVSVNCPIEDNTSDEVDSRLGNFMQNEVHSVMNELSLKEEFGEEWGVENAPLNNIDRLETDGVAHLDFDINEETFISASNINNDIHIEDEEIGLDNDFDDLGMSKEIEFLLKENQDLIETKNALNIVKDDLITKLDELTGELCILREDLRNANTFKKQFKAQIQDLEKTLHEAFEQIKEKDAKLLSLGEDENLIECAVDQNGVQTKTKFTRAEVARILLERNKYKEELLELQESMRYQMAVINQKNERAKKGSMWNFFSNVVTNATAFTTEAFIGSGNEMTVTQLNRNFAHHHKKHLTFQDEGGEFFALPNLSNESGALRKRPIPGAVVRVSNPLFNPLQDTNDTSMVNLVPLDESGETKSNNKTINDSFV